MCKENIIASPYISYCSITADNVLQIFSSYILSADAFENKIIPNTFMVLTVCQIWVSATLPI